MSSGCSRAQHARVCARHPLIYICPLQGFVVKHSLQTFLQTHFSILPSTKVKCSVATHSSCSMCEVEPSEKDDLIGHSKDAEFSHGSEGDYLSLLYAAVAFYRSLFLFHLYGASRTEFLIFRIWDNNNIYLFIYCFHWRKCLWLILLRSKPNE